MWVEGKRHGWGTSLYDGKFGYDRWEGPFIDDKAHGVGTMFHDDEALDLRAFREWDEDSNGVLSREEFVGRLCGDYGSSFATAGRLFELADANGDGMIQLGEFIDLWKKAVEGKESDGTDIDIDPSLLDVARRAFAQHGDRRSDQRPPFEFVEGVPVLVETK